MLAYVLEADDTASLREIPRPQPGPGEVLIRVRASALNPHDVKVRSGFARSYLEYELPAVLGTDLASEVAATGDGAHRVAVGARVFGLERSFRVHVGRFAEYVVLPAESVVKTPDDLHDADAGALGLAALTALKAIDAARLEPGSTILINGATGGVGCYATQFATASGARVLATARPGAEADLPREFGRGHHRLERRGCRRRGGARRRCGCAPRRCHLRRKSTRRTRSARAPSRRARAHDGGPDSRAEMIISTSSPELLARIARHAASGDLTVRLRATFALAEIDAAFAALRGGGLGKVGLSVS